jgi:D-serine deaminase-like pyridoxal phosphate-dependent protein
MQETQTLNDLATPCLVLDVAKVERNIARLRAHLVPMGVTLRPHLKTGKSVEVARMVMDTPEGPATVSTLKEAHLFAAAGSARHDLCRRHHAGQVERRAGPAR